jgi:alanine racemase
MKEYSRVHADIDLDAFSYNLQQIKNCRADSGTKIMAVIKTDGYGHGALALSEVMEQDEDIWGYAVASVDEGKILRRAGRRKPILILGYSFPDQYEEMIELDIRTAVFSYETARQISKAARRLGKTAKIHIKLDTGMSRIGFAITEDSADDIVSISQLPNLEIEGIFTHFARADEKDKRFTECQAEAFDRMIDLLMVRGLRIPIHHISNSAGIIDLPQYNKDLVRAGIILYGLWPSDEVDRSRISLKPLMSIHSQVVLVKKLGPGKSISYGGTYKTSSDEIIATVPVGYGDGYPRSLSNKGYVLIRGCRAPIRGRVCMDQFMVDVTHIPDVQQGEPVTLLGRDGEQEITMEELGELSGRFNYELACDLSKRIPRNYLKNGEIVSQYDFFAE